MAATTKAVGLGLLVLLVVFSVPMMIDASEGDRTYRVEFQEGAETEITDRINVTSENIRPPAPENATITVTDTSTFESDTQVINNGSSAVYQFDAGNVTVAITAVETSPEAFRADVKVDRTYGWSDGGKSVAGELGLIMVILGAVIIAGAIGAMIES